MIMKKKINVYIVLTEYQFLQALNIATSVYNSSEYINKINIIRDGRRLMGINKEKDWRLGNIEIFIFDNMAPRKIASIILSENSTHFLYFQAHSPLNVFLGDSLSKRGVEISLGPDGYSSYNIFKKKNPVLTFIKDTLIANKYLIHNKLFKGRFYPFDYYKYGNNKFIDNIWVTHPEQYIHQAKNKVNILKLPDFNKECIDFIKDIFDFNENFPMENVIYYFNQPLWEELIETEFDFLNEVIKYFPDVKIILKLHPLTSEKTKALYKAIARLTIIESSVPAEVILIELNNCIAFSGWSSALIMENKICNYYFNYPLYKNSNVKVIRQSEIIKLDHITMIKSPYEMKFPLNY